MKHADSKYNRYSGRQNGECRAVFSFVQVEIGMAKQAQERVCLDCGKTFVGNPRARYCPQCRELRKSGTSYVQAQQSKPGPLKRLGSKIEPIKRYLSFWRLVILNVICLAIGFACAWYLHNQPFSYETQQTLEAFAPTNLALTALLVWGSAMRFFYWYKDKKTDNPFWRENYWKQLVAWLGGILFTECWAVFFLLT